MYRRYQMSCPGCDSQDIERIHRSRLEKIMRRKPKFLCLRCKQKFFRKIEAEKLQATR
jgi:hypothetical protein